MDQYSLPYRELCTEYYELDKPHAPKEALSFYLQQAQETRGPILEPMCGTGNFLIPILEEGYSIQGFDNSPHMLDLCRAKSQKKGLTPDLQLGSFDTMDFDKAYSLVIIPNSSLCLLTADHEILQALILLNKAMASDGKLVFEVETPFAAHEHQGIWMAHSVDKPDGSKLVLNTAAQFDPLSHVETVLCRYELWQENHIKAVQVETFCVRLHRPSQIEAFLDKSGFKVVRRRKPYSEEPPAENADIILYECTKK